MMKKNKLILITFLFVILTFSLLTQYSRFEQVIKSIEELYPLFVPIPVKFLSVEHYGNELLLSWSIPSNKLYDHIEIYYGDSLLESNRIKGNKIKIKGKKKTYYSLSKNLINNNAYFAIYAVDIYGRYSEPKYAYIQNKDKIDSVPNGLFEYEYLNYKIKYAYHVLENEEIKAFFSKGVLLGIESKNNEVRIRKVNFNFLNSYLTAMDIYGKDGIVFSLYRDYYEEKPTWLEVIKNNNKIIFKRHYINDQRNEIMEYTLLNNKIIHIRFYSDFKEKRYSLRINFLGDDDFKAVTSWEAKNVSSIIHEHEYDNTNMEIIESQYDQHLSLEYKHKEEVFNDTYPYIKSRRYLKINPNTIFNIYHNEKKIFTIYGSSSKHFFYKNCSGEEDFTFGHKFPYSKGTNNIERFFEVFLKQEY